MNLLIRHEKNDTKVRLRVGLSALGLYFLLSLGLQSAGFYRRFDEYDLDHYARTVPTAGIFSDRITIIAVTEDDYRDSFDSQSPLNQKKLLKLIRDVQGYHPRVIGVDFLTGDWPHQLKRSDTLADPPIVWTRDGVETMDGEGDSSMLNLRGRGVAGFSDPPSDICYAAAASRQDPDGTIRRYFTAVSWRGSDNQIQSVRPSMARVLASSYPDHKIDCSNAGSKDFSLIRFAGDSHQFRTISAAGIRTDAKSRPEFDNLLRNRIVLIGGTFAAARDRWWCSPGYVDGVQILAHSVETEISGGVGELSPYWSAIVGLTASLVMFGCLFRVPQPWDTVCSAVVPVVIVMFVGYFAFANAHVFLGVGTWMIGVPIATAVQHYVELLHHLSSVESKKRSFNGRNQKGESSLEACERDCSCER